MGSRESPLKVHAQDRVNVLEGDKIWGSRDHKSI